jgi:hypothetical protein
MPSANLFRFISSAMVLAGGDPTTLINMTAGESEDVE